jgi:hypothetical protein
MHRAGRSPQPSPAPTKDSIASLSSSTSDMELDLGLSPARSPRAMPREPSGYSESASVISSASSRGSSLLAAGHSEQGETQHPVMDSEQQDQPHRGTLPQFIMPSLAVPQRRPFSDTGKAIGKLKILLAGPAHTGKNSLVQAIAHFCEDIVHVDQATTASHTGFKEIWASTRPQPWWQHGLDATGSHNLGRASSVDVLDRNLCFVVGSLPGYSNMNPGKGYIEAQISPLLEKSMDESDLSSLISGGGSSVVDAVFYMIPQTGTVLLVPHRSCYSN